MPSGQTYSGDVTLSGDESTPVRLDGAENVHVLEGSVAGDLKIDNAEYVFTNTSTDGTTSIGAPETEISGSLEDGYVEPGGVDGDLVIANTDDVFIEHDAVGGSLEIIGAERQFHDPSEKTPLGRSQYDRTVTGWERSMTVENPSQGVAVAGGRSEAKITEASGEVEVFVTGWQNSARIEGSDAEVILHVIGSHNKIKTGPYTDLTVATESGIENEIRSGAVPASDLIRTSKKEAYRGAFIGRKKITYQSPAPEEPHCPNCGTEADAIIQRHHEDTFFLFGYPLYQYDAGDDAYECESCSRYAHAEAELSESERQDLLG
jgi:hypothetical protein